MKESSGIWYLASGIWHLASVLMMALRIGWFSTGRDEAARKLLTTTLNAISRGELDVAISFVFCNREDGEDVQSDAFLDLVRKKGLPLICLSSRKFEPDMRRRGLEGDEAALKNWRTLYHREVLRLIEPFEVELSFLAGYMLIVSDEMCHEHTMLNLHPALPGGPKGAWEDVIWQLIKQRASETGVMIHIVTPELDAGPPVTFCKFSLGTPDLLTLWDEWERTGNANRLFQEIRLRELEREMPLILLTLQKLAEGAIVLKGQEVWAGGKLCPDGYDLSEEVESRVQNA